MVFMGFTIIQIMSSDRKVAWMTDMVPVCLIHGHPKIDDLNVPSTEELNPTQSLYHFR